MERSVSRPKNPILDRRDLANALRELREAAQLTLEQAATDALDASGAKLSRMETGKQVAGPRDVRDLCRLYGASEERTAQLISWANSARETGWWESFSVNDDDYVGLETVARKINEFQVSYIPGLLQTQDYAREFVARVIHHEHNQPWGEPEITEWLQIRSARQRIVEPDSGVQLSFVVDEAALLRGVGAPQMRGQLTHLKQVAEQSNVRMRVLPLTSGVHPAIQGGFTVLTLPNEEVAYVESQGGKMFLTSQAELLRIRSLYQVLWDSSPNEGHTQAALDQALSRVS
jgi:transcriptional regulator with XRE-family HTH domain